MHDSFTCHVQESETVLQRDLCSTKSNDVHYGVKLVRGAYMEEEREKASAEKYKDPIWKNKEDTDNNYHELLDMLLREVPQGKTHVMVATHNESTVLFATEK